jgi:sialic acid synthase SpsE
MIKFIADICSNHNGVMLRARSLIREAKEAGCLAVKFQLFNEKLHDDEAVKKVLRKRRMPDEFIPLIAEACKVSGIEFHCTPFSLEAVDLLAPHVSEFKIGSHEILWLDLIRACAATNKPLGISCGWATQREIREAIDVAAQYIPPKAITLYHCVPEYPAMVGQANMISIPMLKNFFPGLGIGYSDHTSQFLAVNAAAAVGAEVVEFHLDLDDGQGAESEHDHCWGVSRAREMIAQARITSGMVHGRPDQAQIDKMRMNRTDPTTGSRPIKPKNVEEPKQ